MTEIAAEVVAEPKVDFDEDDYEKQGTEVFDTLEADDRRKKFVRVAVVAALLLVLGFALFLVWKYRDKLTFWRSTRTDTVERTDSALRAEVELLKRRLGDLERQSNRSATPVLNLGTPKQLPAEKAQEPKPAAPRDPPKVAAKTTTAPSVQKTAAAKPPTAPVPKSVPRRIVRPDSPGSNNRVVVTVTLTAEQLKKLQPPK